MFMRPIVIVVLVVSATIGLRPACAIAAPQYNIVALDVLPVPQGDDPFDHQSYAYAINDHAVIVGESTVNTSGNIGQTRPVMWNGSGPSQELWSDQTFGGKGLGLNSAGFIVGRYGSGSGIPLPGPGIPAGGGFIWNPTTSQFTDLGDLGGSRVEATGINELGQVVGSSENVELNAHAFIWDSFTGMHDLGTLDGVASRGTAINNTGEVVGWSSLTDGTDRAFIWNSAQGMQPIGTVSSRAFAINDLGQIVGETLGNGVSIPPGAFLWDSTNGFQSIGSFAARDINNSGIVVGYSENLAGQSGAIVWEQQSGAHFLHDLAVNNGAWDLWIASSINGAGEIVGYGRLNDEVRAFIALPIPEPTGLQLSSTILALICFSNMRRVPLALPVCL